ncbi:MAG TPA: hypothetical protein DDW49_08815 [Deltaproteobacteria bacterium]|nr:MAG: hypothetical protein A2048_00280 [Deltaproteobacteria bacterium GWA2_45_12]HBF13464.1 hypothetical protein [Deltaproteobacteria bacterium]
MKSRFIPINGLKQKVYFWGNPKKPVLVLVHGWLDTGASFDFLCRHLEKDFYCVAPDMRGYGKSEHGKNPLGYFFFEYVADLHALVHKISPHKKVNLLGHSLGGAVTSIYAGLYPEKMDHLINVEGFGFRDELISNAPARVRRWLEGFGTKRFRMHNSFADFAQRLRQSNTHLPQDRALFLARHLGRQTKKGVIIAADPLHKLMEPYSFSTELFFEFWKNIKARCLLIHAKQTEMNQYFRLKNFEKEMTRRMKAFPKGTKRVALSGCGHMVHHEVPEELAEVVKKFLIFNGRSGLSGPSGHGVQ